MVTARELACKSRKDTIPDLINALETERVSWVKLDLAIALARMGDEAGFRSLRQSCDDAALEIGTRLIAAEFLLRLRNELHLETIAQALQPNITIGGYGAAEFEDVNTRLEALRMVRYLGGLTATESTKIEELVLNCLDDSDSAVRVEASTTLVMLADVSAIPVMEAVLSRESDDQTRRFIAYNPNALKTKKGIGANETKRTPPVTTVLLHRSFFRSTHVVIER